MLSLTNRWENGTSWALVEFVSFSFLVKLTLEVQLCLHKLSVPGPGEVRAAQAPRPAEQESVRAGGVGGPQTHTVHHGPAKA